MLAGQIVMHGTEVKVRRRLRNAGAADALSAGIDEGQGPDGEEYGPYETLETFSTEHGRIAALRDGSAWSCRMRIGRASSGWRRSSRGNMVSTSPSSPTRDIRLHFQR